MHGHHKIMILTVDTDVVLLAVSTAYALLAGDELWLAFGIGNSFRYVASHEIATGLGPEKARALPMFHALTGCDNVSSFAGHGKKTGAPGIYALLKLSFAPSAIPEDVLFCNERFVILIYDRTSTSNNIGNTRIKLFKKTAMLI